MSPRLIELWEGLPVGVLALAFALTAGCGSAGTREVPAPVATGPDPLAIAAYTQALEALRGGDEAGATAKFQALTVSYPDYAGPLVNLAVIHARHDELEPASVLLQRAVAVCTHCAAPWNELGLVQRRQGRFAEAEQSYLKAIAADPAYTNATFNLAVLYELYLQRPELALAQYGRFRELAASDPEAADVDKWITDLARRTKTVERSAQVEDVR